MVRAQTLGVCRLDWRPLYGGLDLRLTDLVSAAATTAEFDSEIWLDVAGPDVAALDVLTVPQDLQIPVLARVGTSPPHMSYDEGWLWIVLQDDPPGRRIVRRRGPAAITFTVDQGVLATIALRFAEPAAPGERR